MINSIFIAMHWFFNAIFHFVALSEKYWGGVGATIRSLAVPR